jgi:ribosomal-protein-alanine N-acetyltransferase
MSPQSPIDSPAARWPLLPLPVPDRNPDAAFVLRPWAAQDAEALAAAWVDPEMVTWLSPPGADLASAKRWIDGAEQRRETGLALDLVVEADGVAGEVGFSSFDTSRRACLVGYWVAPSRRGEGLGAHALREACAWVRDVIGAAVVVAECNPANQASQRTAENAGFELLAASHRGSRVYTFR